MMVCKVCGADNEERAKYCAVCGSPLRPEKKSKSGLAHPWLLATAAAVVVGCVYGIGLALFML